MKRIVRLGLIQLMVLAGMVSVPTAAQDSETAITYGAPTEADGKLIFRVGDQGECDRITDGEWDLSNRTLEIKFAQRVHPHENSSFILLDGVANLTGEFKEVVLPDSQTCELRYDPAKGRVVASRFRPTRAPAFPGVEGFGKYTLGGRGGKVYAVTNLNDSGPGSFRDACKAEGPRTVVFRVSGTIALQSEIKIKNPYITIAGQTAPGDGICIKDYMVGFSTDHLIVRYMRFRPGDEVGKTHDGFGGEGDHIVVDHCSVSWSVDEALSINKASNHTVQWCIVSESLYRSIHEKGEHGYGGLWGGPGGSFHHNLLAHHTSRNPRASGNRESGLLDFRNNVVYNWGFNSAYGGELWPRNWINNYYKYGPATVRNVRNRIFIQSDPRGRMYASGNFVYGAPSITANNWVDGIQFSDEGKATEATLRVNEEFVVAPVKTDSAEEAFEKVLAEAGASLRRDSVDTRIIEETRNGTATHGASFRRGSNGIIDSPKDVGGWPELKSETAPQDSDNDGMPDDWEEARGLDPKDGSDGARFETEGGYTHLELYLDHLVRGR